MANGMMAEAKAGLAQALAEAVSSYSERNPKSAAQLEKAARFMPGGNTRTSLFYTPFPLTMARGQGARLWDLDGHEYIDLIGEFTAGLYGHSSPVIRAAIIGALDQGLSLAAHNVLEVRLAQAVCERFPSIELVRFTNSGSEANMMAVGLARAHTGRDKILVFKGGYHGAFMSGFGYAATNPSNAPHQWIVADYNDPEGLAALVQANADRLAAILMEPMLGSAGCIPATEGFLQAARDQADRVGALLIFDEVMTSRLSPGGLQQASGVTPDLTTLGKYLGGGSSFGAFGGRADIMQRLDPSRPGAMGHAGTFNNNVISMAAGHAGLSELYTPPVAIAHNARGDTLRRRLNALCKSQGVSLQFTGMGSLMNVHPVRGEVKCLADVLKGPGEVRDLLFFHLVEDSLYMARRGFVALSLALTDADLDAFVTSVERFIVRYRALLAPDAQADV
jgi:glutamate-1-semialdehyde 2,1-aminomutase